MMPYCTVQVAHHAGNGGWAVDDIAEVMTTTQKRGPDPVWEEEFTPSLSRKIRWDRRCSYRGSGHSDAFDP